MSGLLGETLAWFADPVRWTYTPAGIPYRVVEHLWVTLVAMAIALVLSIPPALWLAHHRRAEAMASAVVNLGRAIPSFGLIVLFWLLATRIDWIGTAFWPLVLALTALAMPPVFTNTYTAVRGVDAATVEAARGMGYTEPQVLRQIELPLASPVMLAGVRIAFIQVLATTAIGAIVTNGGGLGRYVVDGFARGVSARPMVLAGAIMLAGLTLLADAAFNLVERAVVPAGVRDDARLADVANRAGAAG